MAGKPEYNIERIAFIVSDIDRYSRDLDELRISTMTDLQDKRNFYAVSMILFSLLNRVFDLGSEICIAHNLGIPTTYRDIFIMLQKNGIIGDDLARDMTGLVTYRNLLSHEYHGIDVAKLFALTKKIATIQDFSSLIRETIRRNG